MRRGARCNTAWHAHTSARHGRDQGRTLCLFRSTSWNSSSHASLTRTECAAYLAARSVIDTALPSTEALPCDSSSATTSGLSYRARAAAESASFNPTARMTPRFHPLRNFVSFHEISYYWPTSTSQFHVGAIQDRSSRSSPSICGRCYLIVGQYETDTYYYFVNNSGVYLKGRDGIFGIRSSSRLPAVQASGPYRAALQVASCNTVITRAANPPHRRISQHLIRAPAAAQPLRRPSHFAAPHIRPAQNG